MGRSQGAKQMWERKGHREKVASSLYKGYGASHNAIHAYLNRYFPKKGTCINCKAFHGKSIHRALIHGRGQLVRSQNPKRLVLASRDPDDYIELCGACHRRYDSGVLTIT